MPEEPRETGDRERRGRREISRSDSVPRSPVSPDPSPPNTCAVVIICHNYGRFLADCLESVLAQSLPATAILVVLDHCSDESHEVACRYPVEVLSTNACDPHLSRRLGLRSTRSEFLAFLDADDRLSANSLEDGLAAFADPGVGIVSGDIQRFGTDSDFIPAGPGDVEIQNCVTSAALVRRAAIEASGCFEDFSLVGVASEDWECWKRIVRAGWRIANPAVPITHFHRRHGKNRTLSRLYDEDATSQAERRLVPDPGRPLRIGYVSPSAGMGGAETQIVAQIRHARRLDWVAAWVPEEAPRNTEILARLPPLEAGEEGLDRLCQSVDAVYVWGLPHKVAAIRQLTKAPILYGVHGEGEWTRNAVAQIAEQVDVLVCVSHGAVRTVPVRQRHKARLIRGGADLGAAVAIREREEIRRDWGITAGERAVGYVGRLSAEKNPVIIARGVAHLPNAKLVVCSPQAADEQHPLRQEIAAALGVRVVWTSSAMQPMGDIYRGLDCLVVASHEEGMPTVTLEAWAAGLSVASTPVGLIQELEPRYGPLVERMPLDPTPVDVATAIERAVLPNPLCTDLARELVLNELSMQRMTVEFEELVARLISDAPSSAAPPAPAITRSAATARGHLSLVPTRIPHRKSRLP
ncbi:MAG: glycosyltransferase [Planctomycetaceae bacterium]